MFLLSKTSSQDIRAGIVMSQDGWWQAYVDQPGSEQLQVLAEHRDLTKTCDVLLRWVSSQQSQGWKAAWAE